MSRQELSDQEWKNLQPLLPSNEGHPGRDYRDHREVIEGIVWVIRTGSPWRDLPEQQFAPWSTVYGRYRRWVKSGRWSWMFRHINSLREKYGWLDWSAHFIDATVVRAHQKAAGGSPWNEALGVSRGGLSTKVHIRVDRNGHLMNIEVSEGQRQELKVFKRLMNGGAVPIPWGRPKLRPEAVVADKGYNANWVRERLHSRHMAAVIPKYSNQCRRGPFQRDLYRERNLVERKIGRFKEFKKLAFRGEKLAGHYRANWLIVEIIQSLEDLDGVDEL